MVIKIEKESYELGGEPYESCCFCNEKTPFWSTEKDVAVCPKCALVKDKRDIPDKKEWIKS